MHPSAAAAHNRFSQLFAGSDARTGRPQPVFAHIGDKGGVHLGLAAVIQGAEILIGIQYGEFHLSQHHPPCSFTPLAAPFSCLQKGATLRWPLLIGKAFSSLRSSASQHLAAVGSCHSFTETMFHFTMPFLRLIRTKHASSPFRIAAVLCSLAKIYYISTSL